MSIIINCERGSVRGFWEDFYKSRFKAESLEEYYRNFNKRPRVQKIFIKYLPKEGKILDAGCGSGIWTHWLREKGYDVEGIDVSENAIAFIKKNLPNLPVKVGTIFDLDYPDKSLKGYLSLGVMGYFQPDKILQEMARVLDNGGVAILRVPYANPFRRLKSFLGFYKKNKDEESQYAFTSRGLKRQLEGLGFQFIKADFYDSLYGFYNEVSGSTKISTSFKKSKNNKYNKSFLRSILKSFFEIFPMRFLFSHNLIIVAKKL